MAHYLTKASSDKVNHIDQFSGTEASGGTAVGQCPTSDSRDARSSFEDCRLYVLMSELF
jgi:hypothetical protein